MRLALGGNPTVLLPLFVPEAALLEIDDTGRDLRARAGMVLSRQAGHRFLGYLQAQPGHNRGGWCVTLTDRPRFRFTSGGQSAAATRRP
jgi:uncharacterized protein